jgi:hypothetical protein
MTSITDLYGHTYVLSRITVSEPDVENSRDVLVTSSQSISLSNIHKPYTTVHEMNERVFIHTPKKPQEHTSNKNALSKDQTSSCRWGLAELVVLPVVVLILPAPTSTTLTAFARHKRVNSWEYCTSCFLTIDYYLQNLYCVQFRRYGRF